MFKSTPLFQLSDHNSEYLPPLGSDTASSPWKCKHQFGASPCLSVPLASSSLPSLLSPSLCVLFTWLTCSLCAGSFVHQKAPAPGDCLLTFLSRALQISVSSVSLSPPFLFFSSLSWSTLMKCLPGLCKHQVSVSCWGKEFSGKDTEIHHRLSFFCIFWLCCLVRAKSE